MGFAYLFINRTPTQFDIITPTSLLIERLPNAYLFINRSTSGRTALYWRCIGASGPGRKIYWRCIGVRARPRDRDIDGKVTGTIAGSWRNHPPLVGVGAIRIFFSQSIAEIQPLFDFEKYFCGYPFHVVHRWLDLNMRSKICQKQFFWKLFHFLAHVAQGRR